MDPDAETECRYVVYKDYLICLSQWATPLGQRKAEAVCWVKRQGWLDKLSCVTDLPPEASPEEVLAAFDGLAQRMKRRLDEGGWPPADPSELTAYLTTNLFGDV